MEVIIAALVTALGLSTILLYKKHGEVQLRLAETENRLNSANEQIDTMQRRFKPVIDIDLEADKIRAEKVQLEDAIAQTRSTYREKRDLLDKLVREAAIYDEEIKLAELGFYKPHFDFDSSEIYKNRITKNREQQKELVNDKTAIQALTEWTLEGSRAKGRTMMNRAIRLTARAFNNECSTAVANVRWNNVQRMEARIIKAFEAINKLNESSDITAVRLEGL